MSKTNALLEFVFPKLQEMMLHVGFKFNEAETEAKILYHLSQIAKLKYAAFIEAYLTQSFSDEFEKYFPDHLLSKCTLKELGDLIDEERLHEIYSEKNHERFLFDIQCLGLI